MNGETLSLRLQPTPTSVAVCRVFVGDVLAVFGAPDREVEDIRIVVSDIATGLVEAGALIEIGASIGDGEMALEGNCVTELPQTARLLLSDLMTIGDRRWVVNLQSA